MKKLLYIFLSVAFFLSCAENQTKDVPVDPALTKVSDFLSAIESQGFSGSVLVDHKGSVFSKGYGYSDREANLTNDVSTVYDIGSIAKQFTAAGILKLEMQGKLSVDDLISEHFENVPEDKSEMTLHHLLTHSAGFPGGIGDDYEAITETEFVQLAFNTSLITPPGEKYHYSNVGYSLLAIIIEKVSGQTYEKYLAEHLFDPAGMKETGYTLPGWQPKSIAVGYLGDKPWGKPNEMKWDTDAPYLHLKGNGGILSTVGDMYKWHQALLTDDILNATAKKKYYAPHIPEDDSGRSHYGYGWAILPTPRETTLVTHNGGNGIFFADFLRYLSEDITIVMLSNKANRYTEGVAYRTAALLLVPDYEPGMPDEMENEEPDSDAVDALVIHTFETIRDGNPDSWKAFIEEYGSLDFQGLAPMEKHMEFFSTFSERMAGATLETIDLQDDQVIAGIQTPDGTLELTIFGTLDENGVIKIDGLKLD